MAVAAAVVTGIAVAVLLRLRRRSRCRGRCGCRRCGLAGRMGMRFALVVSRGAGAWPDGVAVAEKRLQRRLRDRNRHPRVLLGVRVVADRDAMTVLILRGSRRARREV